MALFDMQVNFVNCFELISKLDFYSWYKFQIIYNSIIVTLFIIILVIQNLLHFIFYNFGFNMNLNTYNYKFRNVKKCSKIDGCNRKINFIQNFEIHLIKIFISFSKNLSFHCITIFFSAIFYLNAFNHFKIHAHNLSLFGFALFTYIVKPSKTQKNTRSRSGIKLEDRHNIPKFMKNKEIQSVESVMNFNNFKIF